MIRRGVDLRTTEYLGESVTPICVWPCLAKSTARPSTKTLIPTLPRSDVRKRFKPGNFGMIELTHSIGSLPTEEPWINRWGNNNHAAFPSVLLKMRQGSLDGGQQSFSINWVGIAWGAYYQQTTTKLLQNLYTRTFNLPNFRMFSSTACWACLACHTSTTIDEAWPPALRFSRSTVLIFDCEEFGSGRNGLVLYASENVLAASITGYD